MKKDTVIEIATVEVRPSLLPSLVPVRSRIFSSYVDSSSMPSFVPVLV